MTPASRSPEPSRAGTTDRPAEALMLVPDHAETQVIGTTPRRTSKPGSVGGWLRRRWLIEQVHRHGAVTTTSAARHLGVSEMTVRRDMAWLADHHGYDRVHGGLLGPGR